MRTLIFITDKYPFNRVGESFISNEVIYQYEFDKVIWLPLCRSKNDSILSNIGEGEIYSPKNLSNASQNWFGQITKAFICEFFTLFPSRHILRKISHLLYFEKYSWTWKKELSILAKEISLNYPGQVIIYSYWFYIHAWIGKLLADELRKYSVVVKLVSRAHGYDVYEERQASAYFPYRDLLLASIDRLYVCSKHGANYISKKFPKYKDKIKTSYLGIPDKWHNDYPRRCQIFTILSCSRMVGVKRIDKLIEALSLIKTTPIKWVHIGTGELYNQLKELASNKLQSPITYEFLGELDNNKVFDFYKNSNVNLFINSSDSEGLPVAIMEALSCGIPVLAPSVGGIPEMIQDGKNGLLLPLNFSSQNIAEKIQTITHMKDDEYSSMCSFARSTFLNKFSDSKNFTDFYEDILRIP